MQLNALHTPVEDLAHIQFVLALAIHRVNRAELLRTLASGAEFSNHGAIELQLIDFSVVKVICIIGV